MHFVTVHHMIIIVPIADMGHVDESGVPTSCISTMARIDQTGHQRKS